jgi:PAS domain S-box-containing protein
MGSCSSVHVSKAGKSDISATLTADTLENYKVLSRNDSFANSFNEKDRMKPVRTSTKSSSSSVSISFGFGSNRSITAVNPKHFTAHSLISKRIWEGQKLCYKNKIARATFASYVTGMTWMGKISVQLLEQIVRRRRTQDTQDITFNDYSLYARSRSGSRDSRDREDMALTMRRCTQLKFKDSMDQATQRKRDLIETCFKEEEMKYILLVSLWPIFVESPEYQSIFSSEPCIIYEDSGEGNDDVSEFDSAKKNDSIKEQDMERTKRLKDIYYQTAKLMTEEEIEEIMVAGNWIERCLTILDNASFSISIASAEHRQDGLPLVYVNKSFERVTLYSKSEAVGRPCKFLQCNRTEQDQLEKITEAIGKGESIKVAVTNARKDGSEFLNFLALRPVFDREITSHMTYVVGVQYDVTKEEASLREIKMVEDFLTMICTFLKG